MKKSDAGAGTELLVGFGSLMSKRGITRRGTAPTVLDAWAIRLPGRRGFSNPVRGGRMMTMDAYLDGVEAVAVRHLPGFVDGSEPAPSRGPGPKGSFEALAFLVPRREWSWFDQRECFPARLGAALVAAAEAQGRSVGAILGDIMDAGAPDSYPGRLLDAFREAMPRTDLETFCKEYLPWPIRLPPGAALPSARAVMCHRPIKVHPPLGIRAACAGPAVTRPEMRRYYVECVLGGAQGVDVSDLRDVAYEAAEGLTDLVPALASEERLPFDAILGDGLLRLHHVAPPQATTHRMRPVQDLVTFEEAMERLLDGVAPAAGAETVAVQAATGRVLAEAIFAPADVPAFDRSAMDGYAVRADDTAGAGPLLPRRLHLVGRQDPAGAPGPTVEPGTSVKVATGSPLPRGADTVVMVERTRESGPAAIEVLVPHAVGKNVSRRGSDMRAGDLVLPAGTRLAPRHVASLAAIGSADVVVRRRPRVAVLPSGDEVVPLGSTIRAGQVFDSNSYGIAGIVAAAGALVERRPIAADTPEALRVALIAALADADLVVTTGGTSAGERDVLAEVLAGLGSVLFHGVRIRPGKPVLAARVGGKTVVGLPGYPASALLTAHLFLPPLVSVLGGSGPAPVATRVGTLGHALRSSAGWRQFVPVALSPEGVVTSVAAESGATTSLARSDGYVVVDEDVTVLEKGAAVSVVPWLAPDL